MANPDRTWTPPTDKSGRCIHAGCELDHCSQGHHLDYHPRPRWSSFSGGYPLDCDDCRAEGRCGECGEEAHPGQTCGEAEEIRDVVASAERAAGWDPNP